MYGVVRLVTLDFCVQSDVLYMLECSVYEYLASLVNGFELFLAPPSFRAFSRHFMRMAAFAEGVSAGKI